MYQPTGKEVLSSNHTLSAMLHSRVATISEYGEVLATKDLSWDWIPTKHRPRPAPILKRPNRLAKIGREAGYRYLQPHAKNTDCLIGQE